MIKPRLTRWVLILAVAVGATAYADADPTLHQVYEAVQAGHVDQAQQMMTQVLHDHPNSAKAHFVAAEVYAKAGRFADSRQELTTAKGIEPSLSFAKPDALRELQSQLDARSSAPRERSAEPRAWPSVPAQHSSFPFGLILALVAGIGLVWMFMRRRNAPPSVYPQYSGAGPGSPGSPGNFGGAAMSPGAGMGGSGIVGSLASGLAVGAGVVAGEELVRHFMDGDHRDGAAHPDSYVPAEPPSNADMGGSDFGVSGGDSWDDSSSSGGGGDDWT